MGKGGYGKGWSHNRRWQHSQQWQPPRQHGYWQEDRRQQPSETSVGNLCAGVVTSAFEGVCSGVASATWAAVQGAAQAFMNSRQPASRTPATTEGACAPADMMRCLAGSSAQQPVAAGVQAEAAVPAPKDTQPSTVTSQTVLNLLELQSRQQLLMQKQLSALQEQQQAAGKAPAASAAEPRKRKAKRVKPSVKPAAKAVTKTKKGKNKE